ncbi:hypothetical protein FPANT_10832 [Fusarium pseudoanthophilum]|uniref:DUF7908 domain-containing protein n=1 Tax=Fusarium pseudoanthophilum TaxID=48495 RepID=A0A8H5KNQ5_9HYPO|nr:hypothetical protein FPANT_10832 [Fusarium pseudoanthophilum]
MRSQISIVTLVGAVGVLSNTFCITYLSTYLVPISQGGALPSTRRQPERSTFAGNTSTETTLSLDVPDSLTSIASQEDETSALTLIDSGSSSLDAEATVVQTDSDTVSLGSTADASSRELFTSSSTLTNSASTNVIDSASTPVTEAISTSSGIIIPTGRSVILQVNLNNDNGRRSINRRALGGFVSPVGTDTCTFASTFNLAEDQLFSNDFPIYYTSGEDYKELLGVDKPPSDSISTGFIISSGSLVFRNAGLPNGEAGFCQTSDGRVYAVFTDGPPQCVPVRLSVHDSSQCQNGQLVGVGSTTIASGTTTSQVASSSSDTLITVSQTEDSTVSPATSSDALLPSSRVSQPESVEPQTSDAETSSEPSSSTIESSDLFSSAATAAPGTETSTTNNRATTGTNNASSTDSVSTDEASSGIVSQSSFELSQSSVTSTVTEETGSTSTVTKASSIEISVTNNETSETLSDTKTTTADPTKTKATTSTKATTDTEDTTSTETSTRADITSRTETVDTTATEPTTTEPSADKTTTEDDTATSNEITTTTDETDTTSQEATTTTADPTTTTYSRPYNDCDILSPEYTAPDGTPFDLFCIEDIIQGDLIESRYSWDFQNCMDRASASRDFDYAVKGGGA